MPHSHLHLITSTIRTRAQNVHSLAFATEHDSPRSRAESSPFFRRALFFFSARSVLLTPRQGLSFPARCASRSPRLLAHSPSRAISPCTFVVVTSPGSALLVPKVRWEISPSPYPGPRVRDPWQFFHGHDAGTRTRINGQFSVFTPLHSLSFSTRAAPLLIVVRTFFVFPFPHTRTEQTQHARTTL